MLKGKRVALLGRNLDDLRDCLSEDIILVDEKPDFVISYGGDGALLGAERAFPGVPKIPIRDQVSNPKCEKHSEKAHIRLLMNGALVSSELMKLKATDADGNSIQAINDIVLHNADPRSAVRYRIWLNGEPVRHQVVGDGVVAATPFGSTAYYRSITRSSFQAGIGIAFNNSTDPFDHIVLRETSVIRIQVTRGPAVLYADNDPRELVIEEGASVLIKKADASVVYWGLDAFRCEQCHLLRKEFWNNKWEL